MTVSGSSFPLASGVLHLALNQARPSGAAVCESAPWLCHREDHPSGDTVCVRVLLGAATGRTIPQEPLCV